MGEKKKKKKEKNRRWYFSCINKSRSDKSRRDMKQAQSAPMACDKTRAARTRPSGLGWISADLQHVFIPRVCRNYDTYGTWKDVTPPVRNLKHFERRKLATFRLMHVLVHTIVTRNTTPVGCRVRRKRPNHDSSSTVYVRAA